MLSELTDGSSFCYNLSYNQGIKELSVRTTRDLFERLNYYEKRDLSIAYYSERFGNYTPLGKDMWGIGSVFTVDYSGNYITFTTKLPIVFKKSDNYCNYAESIQILASVDILLMELNLSGADLGLTGTTQLLSVNIIALSDPLRHNISCRLYPGITNKIASLSEVDIAEVSRAMTEAYQYMYQNYEMIYNKCKLIIQ